MRTRIVMAWGASVLAALLLGAGLTGPGTRAAFSDSVDVTQEIRTGRVAIVLTAVDGKDLPAPVDEYTVRDTLTTAAVDLSHDLTLRNDGTLDIGSLSLTTTPAPAEVAPEMARMLLAVSASIAGERTSVTRSHPLSYWLAEPRSIARELGLAPGQEATVHLHLTGDLGRADLGDGTDLTYRVTATAP